MERSDMELAQAFMRQSDNLLQGGMDEAHKKRTLDHAELKREIVRRLQADFCDEASEFEIKRSFRHNTTRRDAITNALGDLADSGTLQRVCVKTGGRDKGLSVGGEMRRLPCRTF